MDNPGAPADSRICLGFHLALHHTCKASLKRGARKKAHVWTWAQHRIRDSLSDLQ